MTMYCAYDYTYSSSLVWDFVRFSESLSTTAAQRKPMLSDALSGVLPIRVVTSTL
eukprot:m.121778 g.121778  ORF g.121778 m.121778 type:complete len:55 (-) comp13706_c1_seq2:1239-1403(-)